MDNLILVIFPSHYVHIVLVTFLGFRPVAFCVVVLLDNHSVPNSNNNNNNNNNNRQKCCAKGSRKEVKIQEFMYRDITNVEPEMYDYTNNNWSYWNSNEKLKEKFGSCTRKIFDRFITKDSYTWNVTHNTESTAV